MRNVYYLLMTLSFSKKINCIEDSNNFQIDLDNFYKWCHENGMTLNINPLYHIH